MILVLALLLAPPSPSTAQVSLRDLCRAALDHADEVREARAHTTAASHDADAARGHLLPRLFGEADALYWPEGSATSLFVLPFYTRPNNEQELSLNLEQPVFAGGAIWNRYKSRSKAADAARFEQRSVRESVLRETAGLFYELLEAGEAMREAGSSLARRSAHLDAARKRKAAGISTDVETSRAQADVEQAIAAQIEAERSAFDARQRLRDLTGLDVSTAAAMPDPLPVPPMDSDEASDNPDVLAAERRADAAEAYLAGTKGSLGPTLSIGGSYLHTLQSPETIVYVQDSTIGFLKLEWDIFSGGSKWAEVGAARAAYDEAAEGSRRVRRDRSSDAAIARERLRQTQALVQAETARLNAARSAYRSSEQRYATGLDSFLVRFDAETALTEAEASLRRARFAEQRAVLDLHSARGSLETTLLR